MLNTGCILQVLAVFVSFVEVRGSQMGYLIEVRDSRTGYLVHVRDAPGTLPDLESCWDAVAAVAAVGVAAPAAPRHPPAPRMQFIQKWTD